MSTTAAIGNHEQSSTSFTHIRLGIMISMPEQFLALVLG